MLSSPGSPTSTGQVPRFRHAAAASARAAGGIGERDEGAAADAQQCVCVEQKREPQRLLAGAAGNGRRVLDPDPQAQVPGASRVGRHARPIRPGPASGARAPPRPLRARRSAAPGLVPRARRWARPTRCRAPGDRAAPSTNSRSTASSQAEQALGRRPRARRRARNRRRRRAAPCAARRAGSARTTVDLVAGPARSSTSVCIGRRVVGMARAVRGRIDAAEGEAALVLQRRAAVGPQDVALVEHGVGDGLAPGPMLTAPPAAAPRRRRPSSETPPRP